METLAFIVVFLRLHILPILSFFLRFVILVAFRLFEFFVCHKRFRFNYLFHLKFQSLLNSITLEPAKEAVKYIISTKVR